MQKFGSFYLASDMARLDIALLLLFASAFLVDCAFSLRKGEAVSEALLEQVPDPTNPGTKKKLACSSCRAVAKEAFGAMDRLRKLRKGVEKYSEKVEALETVCTTIGKTYGLLMRDNKPTFDFSSNSAISRLQGSWVNTYIESRCGDLMEKYDEDFIKGFGKVSTVIEAQALLCKEWERTCSVEEAAKEDL
jgi:hypothetical protein